MFATFLLFAQDSNDVIDVNNIIIDNGFPSLYFIWNKFNLIIIFNERF